VGLPRPGIYEEVLNTDAAIYGGSGVGNPRFIRAEQIEWQGRGWSVPVTLPPLGAIYLRYRPDLEN
jgi:1,4-alpha-glucan branching enzyme